MRILHTSDWHLGKTLEGESRIEEQECFLEDFINIVNENNIDVVLIAGDIYDTGNPPAKAENMFYDALKRITDGGKRLVIIISGNHDSAERLVAASPLAREHGIIMVASPKSIVETGRYGEAEVKKSGEGFIEVQLKDETLVAVTLPYPSEKRLNEIIFDSSDEEKRRKSYSEKIGEIFKNLEQKYRTDTVNIAVSHIFMMGGETTDSERPIELGGTFAVDPSVLPENAQYVALGHLHRPQKVKNTGIKAYYSGSPLQYSKSEIGYSKSCYIVDVKAGEEAKIETVYFKNYKPIEVWHCSGVEDAIERCKQNSDRNVWVYMDIKTKAFISQEEIKEMRELKNDILQIVPIIEDDREVAVDFTRNEEKSLNELFKDFYCYVRGVEPDSEVMTTFLSMMNEEEGEGIEA